MRYILSAIIPILLISCEAESDSVTNDGNAEENIEITVPSRVSMKQRTTKAIPGTDGKILITIDDITRGQVMVTIAPDQGEALIDTRSMRTGDKVDLNVGGKKYSVKLNKLNNELIGDDSAVFFINREGAALGPEKGTKEEINLLMKKLISQDGAVLIRNGMEYEPADGALHLYGKLDKLEHEIQTTEDFIEKAASKSSKSGKPYQIRLGDGTTADLGDWLKEELKGIRGE